MGFLFPEFLFAWLLMIIPVIIHLFNFRKFKKVYFTNVQFLREVQLQTSSSQKLKEILILAARMLAIFFLVLAFAQPYVKSSQNNSAYQKKVVSIYLDNSYSMESVNKNGSLLDEGKRKIKELIEAYSLNDRFQLLTNNFDGSQQRLLSKEELLESLNEVEISPLVRNYQSVFNRQKEILSNDKEAEKVAFLISDFQKQKDDLKISGQDSSILLQLIPLKANIIPNISIDSVYFLSPIHQPNGKESLVLMISNHADKEVENIPINLNINGNQKALGSVSIKPNGKALDTLNFSGLNSGWQKAELSIKDYPIIFDDNLKFTFEVKSKLQILGVYQNKPINNISFVYQTDSFFDFKESNESQINYSSLNSNQLIVLENLKTVSSGLSQQLKTYIQNGGSLSVFIPLDADLSSYQLFLQNLGADYPITLKKETLKATRLNIQNPIFQNIFDQIPKNPDLPIASQYFSSSSLTKTTKQVLIAGQGKENILSEYRIGKGSLYISFLPLEAAASNFASHALFLPLLFKMALLGANEQTLFYTIGKNFEVNIDDLNAANTEVIHIKGENFELIPEVQQKTLGNSLFFADQIKIPGFYDVFNQNKLLSAFAFNEDRAESKLDFYKETELENLFKIDKKQIIKSEKPINQQIKEGEFGSPLWKLCLILSLMFLTIEILLIRFFKNRIAKPINV